MSVPNVNVNSKVGKALAKTLGMTPEQLDKADGRKDGKLEMFRFIGAYTQHNSGVSKRIIAPHHMSTCENVFLVDNGDGKIGAGDLFLHADGYYVGNSTTNNYTYRMTKLFAPRQLQAKSGAAARTNPKITPKENAWLKAFEALKGQSYSSAIGKMKAVCPKW